MAAAAVAQEVATADISLLLIRAALLSSGTSCWGMPINREGAHEIGGRRGAMMASMQTALPIARMGIID
jgi:hypothetical protein